MRRAQNTRRSIKTFQARVLKQKQNLERAIRDAEERGMQIP